MIAKVYLDSKVVDAQRAEKLVGCFEPGSCGEWCIRADYDTGPLVAMVSGREEGEYLAQKAKRPLSWKDAPRSSAALVSTEARLARARELARC